MNRLTAEVSNCCIYTRSKMNFVFHLLNSVTIKNDINGYFIITQKVSKNKVILLLVLLGIVEYAGKVPLLLTHLLLCEMEWILSDFIYGYEGTL